MPREPGTAVGVFGPPGGGKTYAIHTFKPDEVALITGETNGIRGLRTGGWEPKHLWVCNTIRSYHQAIDAACATEARWVDFDTITTAQEQAFQEYLGAHNYSVDSYYAAIFQKQEDSRRRYGFQKDVITILLQHLMEVVKAGKNLYLTGHSKPDDVYGDAPGLQGQLSSIVCRPMDIVCRSLKVADEQGKAYYLWDCPPWGKDMFGLPWPMPNDLAALERLCRGEPPATVAPGPAILSDEPSASEDNTPPAPPDDSAPEELYDTLYNRLGQVFSKQKSWCESYFSAWLHPRKLEEATVEDFGRLHDELDQQKGGK